MNCQEIKKNIEKLEKLKKEFNAEMEKIRKDGKAGKVWELKKEIEEIVSLLEGELETVSIDIGEYLKEGEYEILDISEELGLVILI